MFKALRDSSKAGTLFRGHRLQRTARLFLFEFVVVLLGVLAAQMLQGWVAERQSRRQADAAVANLRQEAATMVSQAGFWRRSGPCLADHVADIARAAAQDRTMTEKAIGRPALPTPDIAAWDDSTLRAVRASFGEPVARSHQDLEQQMGIVIGFNREIASDWATFGLLDDSLGKPSVADLANVRLAAMKVRTQLRMQQIKAGETIQIADRLGVRTIGTSQRTLSASAADECGLLRNW